MFGLYWFCNNINIILSKKIIQLSFEIWFSNLVYMKITLPKADSKLDKEKETKKDFRKKFESWVCFTKLFTKLLKHDLKKLF